MAAEVAPCEQIVKVMGFSSLSWGISSIISPSIVGFLIDYFQTFSTVFSIYAMISLATSPILVSLSKLGIKDLRMEGKQSHSLGAARLGDEKIVLAWSFVVIAFNGFASGAVSNLFPVYSVISASARP